MSAHAPTTPFDRLIKDPAALCAALESVAIEGQLRAELQRLYHQSEGFVLSRDAEGQLQGDTLRACLRIGQRLGKQLRMRLPREDMLWLATIKRDRRGTERLQMRGEVREVIRRLGWFPAAPPAAAAPAAALAPAAAAPDGA